MTTTIRRYVETDTGHRVPNHKSKCKHLHGHRYRFEAEIEGDVVDIHALKNANLITRNIETAKIMLSGEITRPITVRGLGVTKGARAAIEAAGGKIEE